MPDLTWTRNVGRELLDLLIPPACAACGQGIHRDDGSLCTDCSLDLHRCQGGDYCQTCGEDRGAHLLIDGRCTPCRMGKPAMHFDQFVRVGKYDGR